MTKEEFTADGAKTSEFAYFKKLKKEAGRSELYSRDREKSQFTDAETNHYESGSISFRHIRFILAYICLEIGFQIRLGKYVASLSNIATSNFKICRENEEVKTDV